MDYLVWQSVALGNACLIDAIGNFDRPPDLREGISFSDRVSENISLHMSKRHKKNLGLIDDVANLKGIKICSSRLTAFLKKHGAKNVEYLPASVIDHRGKVASDQYFIVNPVGLQEALDLAASKPRYNGFRKTDIDSVENLVIDPARIDPSLNIFRLKAFYSPVFIRRSLAEAIEAEGFKGSYFSELDEFEP